MANRNWRVAGNFNRLGEVAEIVSSPNWQSAIRKGALAIKRNPLLKGRRIDHGIFTLSVIEGETVIPITGEQATFPTEHIPEVPQGGDILPTNEAFEEPVITEPTES